MCNIAIASPQWIKSTHVILNNLMAVIKSIGIVFFDILQLFFNANILKNDVKFKKLLKEFSINIHSKVILIQFYIYLIFYL